MYFPSTLHPQVILFTSYIEQILKFLHTSEIECTTCGYININCLTDTQRKNQLNSLLISYNPFHTAVSTTSALPDESDGVLQTSHNIQVTGQDQIPTTVQQTIVQQETNKQKDNCKQ